MPDTESTIIHPSAQTNPLLRLDSRLLGAIAGAMYNPQTGMGTRLSGLANTRVGHTPLLREQELRSLYRSSWWIRRLIDVPAVDMTRKGVSVKVLEGGDEDDVSAVMAKYADTNPTDSPFESEYSIDQAKRDAIRWARLFGRAYIVVHVNGGEDPAKPLKRVKSFEGVTVLDRYQLYPALEEVNRFNPTYYMVNTTDDLDSDRARDLGHSFGTRIHRSRVLPYDGNRIHPWDVQDADGGGHDSVVQCLYEIFTRYYQVGDSVAEAMNSFSLFVVTIKDLAGLLGSDQGQQALQKYIEELNIQRSVNRTVVGDADAGSRDFVERSFTGVAENVKAIANELVAAMDLPHYKIWGSESNTNALSTGGAESRAYAEKVEGWQHSELMPNDRRLFKMLFQAATGNIPERFEIEYPSIYVPTPSEVEEMAGRQAARFETLVSAQIIDPLEAKKAIAIRQDLENVLDPDEVEKELEEAKARKERAIALQEQQAKAQTAAMQASVDRVDDKYSHIDFKPPKSVQRAFKRAVEALDNGSLKPGSGLEATTIREAKEIARGETITPFKARKGYRFSVRNKRFADADKDSPAWASWALWGYDTGAAWFRKLWRQMEAADTRNDDATPAKRIIKWQGFDIGLQYFPFDKRHGKVLQSGYGHFRRTRGADDMAVDVYVGPNLGSTHIFVVEQLIDGKFDEEKMVIGVDRIEDAIALYLAAMPREMLGSVREISLADLEKYRVDREVKADAEPFQPDPVSLPSIPALPEDIYWNEVRALADEQGWRWDSDAGQYREVLGELVSSEMMLSVIQEQLGEFESGIDTLTDALESGEIDVADWEELIAETTIALALLLFLLGIGDRGNITSAHTTALQARLRTQLEYLRNFSQSVLSGEMTIDGIRARAKLYGWDAGLNFHEAWQLAHPETTWPYESNVLGVAEHCWQCIEESDRGVVPRGTLIRVGQRACRWRCHCFIELHKVRNDEDQPTVLDRGSGWL